MMMMMMMMMMRLSSPKAPPYCIPGIKCKVLKIFSLYLKERCEMQKYGVSKITYLTERFLPQHNLGRLGLKNGICTNLAHISPFERA